LFRCFRFCGNVAVRHTTAPLIRESTAVWRAIQSVL
jgi:hypothetical protein